MELKAIGVDKVTSTPLKVVFGSGPDEVSTNGPFPVVLPNGVIESAMA